MPGKHKPVWNYYTARAMRIEGKSYREIGAFYGIPYPSNVYDLLRRGARKNGDVWPIPRSRETDSATRSRTMRQIRWQSVKADIIAELVRDYLDHNEMTVVTFVQEKLKLSRSSTHFYYDVLNGKTKTISKKTANNLLRAIGEPVPR